MRAAGRIFNVPVARILVLAPMNCLDLVAVPGARRRSYLYDLDLATYLAARRQVRVYVSVSGSGPHGAEGRGKVTSADLLARLCRP